MFFPATLAALILGKVIGVIFVIVWARFYQAKAEDNERMFPRDKG